MVFYQIQRSGFPVKQRRGGGHHNSVHQVAILFDDFGEGVEIAVEDGLAADSQALWGALEPRSLERAGICQAVASGGADWFMLGFQDGDAIDQVPVFGRGDGVGKGTGFSVPPAAIRQNRRAPSGKPNRNRAVPDGKAPLHPAPAPTRQQPPDSEPRKPTRRRAMPAPVGKSLVLVTIA